MAKYKFKGYTITNCGYHQPDHCVWWEAVDENGGACFHGNTLREVEFMILDYEWEQKMRKKEEEIELLKASKPSGNSAAMREALEFAAKQLKDATEDNTFGEDIVYLVGCMRAVASVCRQTLSSPPRNCDLPLVVDGPAGNNSDKAWRVFKRHNPDAYFDVPGLLRCIDWLLAPAAERKGEEA